MKGKKRHLTLFGNFTKVKTKRYKIYKNPKGRYENFVERYTFFFIFIFSVFIYVMLCVHVLNIYSFI